MFSLMKHLLLVESVKYDDKWKCWVGVAGTQHKKNVGKRSAAQHGNKGSEEVAGRQSGMFYCKVCDISVATAVQLQKVRLVTSGDAIWDSDIVWDTLNRCHFLLWFVTLHLYLEYSWL